MPCKKGMIHAFQHMGVPDHVLTDNMKSVINIDPPYSYPIAIIINEIILLSSFEFPGYQKEIRCFHML